MRRSNRALTGQTIPSGQQMPRDRIGDRKGYYPEQSKEPRRAQHINLTKQCLRHGKQGVSSVNWDAFGAKGSKGKILRDKRPARLQNSPVPHTRVVDGRFDKRTGKWHHAIPAPSTVKPKAYTELMDAIRKSSKPVKPYTKVR